MKFQAYCPYCESKVTVYTYLDGSALKLALDSDEGIRVMHTADIDHQWNLNNHERKNLRDSIASGLLSLGASS